MKGVKIRDLKPGQNVLAVDLRHVLTALGPRALASDWRVTEVWAEGDSKTKLHTFNGSQLIGGERLAALAQNVTQIIDGAFSAFDPGHAAPWVVIEAVDSSFYTVRSDEPPILDQIRAAFREVSNC